MPAFARMPHAAHKVLTFEIVDLCYHYFSDVHFSHVNFEILDLYYLYFLDFHVSCINFCDNVDFEAEGDGCV